MFDSICKRGLVSKLDHGLNKKSTKIMIHGKVSNYMDFEAQTVNPIEYHNA